MTQQKDRLKQPPFAILRGGYKYKETLGMRRVTTYCMDMVESNEVLYVLIRADGNGGHIRRINWKDEDLDIFGNFNWPVQMIQDSEGTLFVSDEGDNCIHSLVDDGEKGFVPIGAAGKGDTAKLETSADSMKFRPGEVAFHPKVLYVVLSHSPTDFATWHGTKEPIEPHTIHWFNACYGA